MRLQHVADRAGRDIFRQKANGLGALTLVAHLGRNLVELGFLDEGPDLVEIVGQRLLNESGLAQPQRADGRRPMMVVRGADQDHVEILVALVEHLAVVVVDLGAGAFAVAGVLDLFHGLGEAALVDVDQGDRPLLGRFADGITAHASGADHRDTKLGSRRRLGKHVGRDGPLCRSTRPDQFRTLLQKTTSRGASRHHCTAFPE